MCTKQLKQKLATKLDRCIKENFYLPLSCNEFGMVSIIRSSVHVQGRGLRRGVVHFLAGSYSNSVKKSTLAKRASFKKKTRGEGLNDQAH